MWLLSGREMIHLKGLGLHYFGHLSCIPFVCVTLKSSISAYNLKRVLLRSFRLLLNYSLFSERMYKSAFLVRFVVSLLSTSARFLGYMVSGRNARNVVK